jgi:hypothetical protein
MRPQITQISIAQFGNLMCFRGYSWIVAFATTHDPRNHTNGHELLPKDFGVTDLSGHLANGYAARCEAEASPRRKPYL